MSLCSISFLLCICFTSKTSKKEQIIYIYNNFENRFVQAMSYWEFNDKGANRVAHDKATHYELQYLDLLC